MNPLAAGTYQVSAWPEIADQPACKEDLDRILFVSANRKSFDDGQARVAFRELWLDQYLAGAPDLAMIASAADGRAIGYCVGWADEPWHDARFDGLDYLTRAKDLLQNFPAHLHINIDPAWRNRGVGAKLIDALADRLVARGVRGLHVTTGHDARNVGFYLQNGFAAAACMTWRDSRLLILTRQLSVRTDAM
jgi:GNAT superfamily N-acetyltransferase